MPWLPASTTRKEVCPLMTSCRLSVVFTLWKVWTTILLCDGYCSLYHLPWARGLVAWENSPHFATSPLVCSWNDVWKMSAENPFWWHVTTWVVFLIGWNKLSANQKHYRVVTSSLWNFCICFSDAISWGNHSGGIAKCRLLSQAWGLVGCANIVLGCIVDNMLVLLILVTLKPSVGEDILLNSKIFFSTNKSFSLLKYLGWN